MVVNSSNMSKRYNEKTVREYVMIFDQYYDKFVKTLNVKGKKKFQISPKRKVQVIDTILSSMTIEQAQALKLMTKFNSLSTASKLLYNASRKRISKAYEIAVRKMYEPKNIAMAVPVYYPKPKFIDDSNLEQKTENGETFTRLTKEDFGGCTYIVTALNKKSDIYYREQLLKHLSLGWFYLWTLPGCGDAARQKILMALDKWEGRC